MKKIIIKSNGWYDDLPDSKRTSFFLIFIVGTFFIVQICAYVFGLILLLPMWLIIISLWRLLPRLLK